MCPRILFLAYFITSAIGSSTDRNMKEVMTQALQEPDQKDFGTLVQEIMIKSLHSYKCIAVISDCIYYPVFQKTWYKRFGGFISFIMIKVEEFEDLLAPNNETQDALSTANANGCQMYIILISNGLQAGRLLKFGDRYRVLNTRSNYILLFDNRLFDKKFLYLWKRIINVIFIRTSNKGDWYELTTVPFPATFTDLLVPRRLDIWTKAKFRKGIFICRLFNEKYPNKRLSYTYPENLNMWTAIFKITLFVTPEHLNGEMYLVILQCTVNPVLNYKWKRIINSMNFPTWWSIFTLYNALGSILRLYFSRTIDWTTSHGDRANLFMDKTADLKNQTLKVAVFPHIPGTLRSANASSRATIYQTDKNNSYSGSEVEILSTISKLMNFQCDIYEGENADVELWGKQLVGGIYSGLLGEMTTTRADVALGDLYYIPFILDKMDLSIPYNTECLTFLTPEALTDISWKTLILPFSSIMWACVIVCLAITGTAFHLLAKFHLHITEIRKACKGRPSAEELRNNKLRQFFNLSMCSQLHNMDTDMKYSFLKEQYKKPKEEDDPEGLYQFSELGNSALYTYSMLLLVSLPKLPTGWSLRMLTGWYWIYCLLLVVAYRASLTAILAKPTPRVTIDTLQELIESKLTYGGWGEINNEFFKSSPDSLMKTIKDNFETVNRSDEAVDRVANGHFAFYENTYFLKEAILKRYTRLQRCHSNGSDTNQNSERNLHIMQDCIINMPVSIGLQKNSPIKPRVDKLIRKLLEAGLVNKWIDDVMQKLLIDNVDQADRQGRKALMDLKKMYGALVVLGIGYFLGLLALATEIWYFRYFLNKRSYFHKARMLRNIKKGD